MPIPSPTLPEPLRHYLSSLARHLNPLPAAERDEILRELESQFHEQLQAGEDPDILAIRMGSAKAYASGFVRDYQQELRVSGDLPAHLRLIWKKALLPAALLLLGWVALMWLNSIWMYGGLLYTTDASAGQVIQLLLAQLPAILVVVLPFAMLWLVPLYLFSLATPGQPYVASLLRQPKILLMTLGLGLGFSLVSFGIQDLLVPAANRQTVTIMKTLMEAEHQRNCGDACAEPLTFMSETDIRNLSAVAAWRYLQQFAPPKLERQPELLRDFYTRFSLPLSNLAAAIFGLLTASLMLSGLFQPYYTLLMLGTLLPLGLWYQTYSWAYTAESLQAYPALSAFAPNLALGGLALLFLLGLVLQRPRQAEA